MIKIEKPMDEVEEVLASCTSNMHNNKKNNFLKDRVLQNKDIIIKYTQEFENKVIQNKVYELKEHTKVGENVDKEEMIKIYENGMVGSKLGRIYYDKILALAPRGICPLCNKRVSNTLDHYLPKAKFPTLAISPINLVPACSDCNKDKLAESSSSMETQPIHPYFDNIDNEEWLFATIEQDEKIMVNYYVKKPESWDEILYKRVCNHMEILGLNSLYGKSAGLEMADMRFFFNQTYNVNGVEGVKKIIRSMITSFSVNNKNSWRIALYREMYNNEWFLNKFIV
ncbi:HNH endonuclease [Clostridium beijerinckii]|uniref:HNH endonuclease n=1 Tax=Clostridium beijerinckii TaxID=1520 RepID=UPI00098BD279|nr:HNH endonuclease signature motif containing protein [Clostridium beijerinckii]MBA8937220.1 5-methylcytosine-specific restriction endonuclease McrA [Clostridium beijerinckii]NRU40314.1 5-methylcytosine-specific restriction endonuclease McrA [Clostridium beijerinckii]NSA96409.1 5-methylcytosine-specific restriction endonuclease McrA [Clostridium beijerinckii]OOM60684.1 hypothetical protein CLOBI_29720 [Clostridium beijerinckii]OOM68606.1 hypothetical protein CLBEIC_32630 [Clostridium beijerin